jgi:hypothetical protein
MPCVAPLAGSRVLERFVLEALRREADVTAICEQESPVGRDEMGHRSTLPHVSV